MGALPSKRLKWNFRPISEWRKLVPRDLSLEVFHWQFWRVKQEEKKKKPGMKQMVLSGSHLTNLGEAMEGEDNARKAYLVPCKNSTDLISWYIALLICFR